jgi:uncharacterized membrane protein YbaN (DUF454 family)
MTAVTYAVLTVIQTLNSTVFRLYFELGTGMTANTIIGISLALVPGGPFAIYQIVILFEARKYTSYYREYRILAQRLEREETTTRKALSMLALFSGCLYVVYMIGFMLYFHPGWSVALSSWVIVLLLRDLVYPTRRTTEAE